MQQAVDYDTQLARVHALLTEWGECQRREPSPVRLGYPRASVEGRMMDQWGERNDGTIAARPKSGGPKQTVVRAIKTGGEWPEHIQRVDRVLARLDRDTARVLRVRYIIGLETVREIANYFGRGMGKSLVAARLERAKWFLLGALAEVDA